VIAPTVQVLYPNGGEILSIGSNVTLTWSASDVCGGVVSVDLLLSRNGVSGTYVPIAQGITNTGAYVWVVTSPKTQGTNPTAFLKVVARDPGGNSGQDVSNQGFRIK